MLHLYSLKYAEVDWITSTVSSEGNVLHWISLRGIEVMGVAVKLNVT